MLDDRDLIVHLSTDRAFGILTRPAFEHSLIYYITIGPELYCVDFDGIHKLNKALGYEKVNQIFTDIFEELYSYHPSIIIGRVFSGDEIAINSASGVDVIGGLLSICKPKGIGFKYVKGSMLHLKTVDDAAKLLDEMSAKLQSDPHYYSIVN